MSKLFNFLSIKKEIKQNLSLSVPLITSQLIYASSGFVSTAMVAQLGKNALAATILVNMVWFSLSVLFFGILNAVSVLVSHQQGANNNVGIRKIMGQAYILGVLVTLCILSLLLNVPRLLQWTGQPTEVLALATHYVFAMIWMIPALIILIISEQFLAGIGRAKIILRISCIVVPIEITLIYFLVFGMFGLPACGVAGVGYGLTVTYTLTAIGLVVYLHKASFYRKFQIFSCITELHYNYLKELLRVGIPMGMMSVIEVTTFAVATLWIGKFGTTLLAAHQIIMQYLGFAITLVFAMSQAVTIRIGHVANNNNIKEIRHVILCGILLNFVAVICIAISFSVIPELFIRFDLDIHAHSNAVLIHHASQLLAIAGILLVFDNIRIIGFGALRGLKDTKFPMVITFFSFWVVGLAAAYSLAFRCHLEGRGVWWGLTIGIAVAAVTMLIRIHYVLARVDLKQLSKI